MPKDKDNAFGYRRRTVEDAKRRASEKGGNFDSFIKQEFKRYKPRDGKNLIRILQPTWDDAKHYAYTIHLNYGIGVDTQTFLSLSEMKGEKDPLQEAKKEAQREGDKKTAKALTPRKRSLMWVIDRLDEEAGPQLWDCPFTVDTDFMNLAQDEDTKEVLWVDDPKTGNDIRFYKEGTGLGTKYPAARMKILSESPLHEDLDIAKEWIEYITENPVPDCLNYHDYEHIVAAFDGTVRTDDEDKDEKPKRRRDDDDDEADEKPKKLSSRERSQLKEDDDEADEKPTKKKAAADDEDDAAADDIDEDEKPRQSVRDRLKMMRSKRTEDADDD